MSVAERKQAPSKKEEQLKLHVRKMSIEELEVKITKGSEIIDSKTISFSRYLLLSEESSFMEIFPFSSHTENLSLYIKTTIDSFLILVLHANQPIIYKRINYDELNITPESLNYLLTL